VKAKIGIIYSYPIDQIYFNFFNMKRTEIATFICLNVWMFKVESAPKNS